MVGDCVVMSSYAFEELASHAFDVLVRVVGNENCKEEGAQVNEG